MICGGGRKGDRDELVKLQADPLLIATQKQVIDLQVELLQSKNDQLQCKNDQLSHYNPRLKRQLKTL